MIDLEPQHLKTVKHILARHIPQCEIRAFGSRTNGKAWKYSDLDLAIVGHKPIDQLTMAQIRDEFEASDIPIIIDILDWHTTTESFRKTIETQGYKIIQHPNRT